MKRTLVAAVFSGLAAAAARAETIESVYTDLDIGRDSAFEPIGVSCRICDRRDCHQRAAPPLKRKLGVDFDRRDTIPYSFE